MRGIWDEQAAFRVWDTKNKEMIYIADLYWFEENGVHDFTGDCHWGQKILKFMRPTEITDKNGEDIFEGDIIKFEFPKRKAGIQKKPNYMVVVWHKKYARFMLLVGKREGELIYQDLARSIAHGDHWVAGNMYENTELLK